MPRNWNQAWEQIYQNLEVSFWKGWKVDQQHKGSSGASGKVWVNLPIPIEARTTSGTLFDVLLLGWRGADGGGGQG